MTKDPGKDFSPDDFVRNPTTVPTKVPATPGKATRTDGYTGNDAYDQEPYCQREPGAPGCGLLDWPRSEMIGAIGRHSITVAKNMQIAVMKCERDILAAEKKDLELFPAMMIGLLGIAFGNVLTPLVHSALTAVGAEFQTFTSAALTRLPLTFYSTKALNAWKAPSTSDAKMKMLQHVESTVDTNMLRLFEHAKQALNDDELKVLADAMQPNLHTPQMYYEALTAMLKRYEESGIKYIGRGGGPVRENPGWRDDSRAPEDTRVIWIPMGPGRPPVLFYQHVDASADARSPNNGVFGEKADGDSRMPKATIGKPVESEFIETAIAAHIAKWGPVVPSTLDAAVINAARANLGIGADRQPTKTAQP